MRIPNPYFENVPKYGNLVMEQIVVEYVYPLLSVLTDGSGNKFLCMCFDTRGSQQWLISPISSSNLVKMLTNKLTLREAFLKDADTLIYAFRDYGTRKDSFEQMRAENVPLDYLPEAGEYLDAEQNEWDDYIRAINTSACAWVESWVSEPIFSNCYGNSKMKISVHTTKRFSTLNKPNRLYEGKAAVAQCIPCGRY